MRGKKQGSVFLIIFVIAILIDQGSKILVKTHMGLGENSYDDWGWPIRWFQIYFIENPGMAWGVTLGDGSFSKPALTLIRIVLVALLGVYVYKRVFKEAHTMPFIFLIALFYSGAVGNLIDGVFYGVLFGQSTPGLMSAEMFPEQGYAPLLHGKVVDMLYFPIIDTELPSWIPFVGGDRFTFFDPIFNLADSYISIGVIGIILFFRKELNRTLH